MSDKFLAVLVIAAIAVLWAISAIVAYYLAWYVVLPIALICGAAAIAAVVTLFIVHNVKVQFKKHFGSY